MHRSSPVVTSWNCWSLTHWSWKFIHSCALPTCLNNLPKYGFTATFSQFCFCLTVPVSLVVATASTVVIRSSIPQIKAASEGPTDRYEHAFPCVPGCSGSTCTLLIPGLSIPCKGHYLQGLLTITSAHTPQGSMALTQTLHINVKQFLKQLKNKFKRCNVKGSPWTIFPTQHHWNHRGRKNGRTCNSFLELKQLAGPFKALHFYLHQALKYNVSIIKLNLAITNSITLSYTLLSSFWRSFA